MVPASLPVLDLQPQPERPDAVVGGLSEDEAVSALRSMAALNDPHTEMIGRGYHPTVTPAVIVRDVLSNPAWSTLRAVQEGNFYTLEHSLYNLKPNARWGEAYEKLSDILYS